MLCLIVGALELAFGRPVRVSVTSQIVDTLASTLQQLLRVGQQLTDQPNSLESSSASLAEYVTPLQTPSKLQPITPPSPIIFPLSVNFSTSQLVLEVFGSGEPHVQVAVGASELQLARQDGNMQSMAGQLECVGLSACLVSTSLSSQSTCRHRLVLPFVLQSPLLLWQSQNQSLCCQLVAKTSDVHVFLCQKRLADLQILAQSLQQAAERLMTVRTIGESSYSIPTTDERNAAAEVADAAEVDQLVRYQLRAPSTETDSGEFVMPEVNHVAFWTDHHLTPARASLTWRYSLPRFVRSIDVTPVPWGDSDPAHVPAELQAWDCARNVFVPVLSFNLHVMSLEQLPVKSEFASCIWRVEASCLAQHVVPQLLVACILVHSSPANVRDVAVSGSSLQLHLFNAYTYSGGIIPGKPPATLHQSFPALQEFAVLALNKWLASCVLPATATAQCLPHLSASAELQLEVVDFSSLQLLPCLSVEAISVRKQEKVEIDVGRCCVHVSQSGLHTLYRSTKLWTPQSSSPPATFLSPVSVGQSSSHTSPGSLSSSWDSPAQHAEIFLHHYLIQNDTFSTLLLGQAETDECIVLEPGQLLVYSWKNVHRQRTLQLATRSSPASVGPENTLPSSATQWCEPFSIDSPQRLARWVLAGWNGHEGQTQMYADQPARVIVDIAALTSVQRHITIRGTAWFASYLPKDLEISWWFRPKAVQKRLDELHEGKKPGDDLDYSAAKAQDKHDSQSAILVLVSSMTSTPSWLVPDSCSLVMRLRFAGASEWSGGVPFQCLMGGHQFQTMAIPTGLSWPLLQIYFHIRVVNRVRGTVPLLGCVSPLVQFRNHMPNWCAVHMSSGKEATSFASWIPPAGGQLHVSHLAINEMYKTGFELQGVDLMSEASLPLSCDMRHDIPTVQPRPSTDTCMLVPEQRALENLQVRWPHLSARGPVAIALNKLATNQFNLDHFMLRYVDLTTGPTRPVTVVDNDDEPVVPVEDSSSSSVAKAAAGQFEKQHFNSIVVVSVHRLTSEMETLQVELAPWCLLVNRTPHVVLFSLGQQEVVEVPPHHVLVPHQFNVSFL